MPAIQRIFASWPVNYLFLSLVACFLSLVRAPDVIGQLAGIGLLVMFTIRKLGFFITTSWTRAITGE